MNNTKHWLNSFKTAFYFTLFLWVIQFCITYYSIDIRPLTIQPGEAEGLPGVIFAPLLHSSWSHLAANSLPLILLGGLQSYGYPLSKWKTLLVIWVISGSGVWLFGRPSYHLGASGLTTGLFYFLFIASILRRDRVSIALMCIAVFTYGGILLGIFPQAPGISFEAHFFGAIGGSLSAFIFHKQDPPPRRKVYDWENEDESIKTEEEAYWIIEDTEQNYRD